MKPREWYQAEIRWAVMEAGKRGLRGWEDAVYFFLSEDEDSAFLQCLGSSPTEFAVHLGSRKATERLPF